MAPKLYDITLPLSSRIPVWPGDPPLQFQRWCDLDQGDPCRVTAVTMSLHTGTHIDAPRHFIPHGKEIADYPPERFFGRCQVVDFGDAKQIDAEAIPDCHAPMLLCKTKNSESIHAGLELTQSFIHLTEAAAQKIIQKNVGLIGIDYYSVEPDGEHPVHRLLLSHDVLILEGIDLSEVPAGEYDLYCVPLRLENAEAAPARAILIRRE